MSSSTLLEEMLRRRDPRLRVAAVAAIRLPPCSHGADVRVGLSLIHILTVDETAATVLPPDTGAQAPAETGHSGRARDDAVRVRPGLRAPGRGSSRRAGARKALGAHDGRPAAESRRSIPRIGRCTRLRPRREPGVRRVVVHAPAVERAGITHRRAASRTGRPGPPERPRAPASPSVRAPDRRAPAGRRVPAAAAPGAGAVLGATAQRARTPRA